MAEITAGMVKELREATGLGMMECKKALTESGGDMKKAEELLRIKSGAKASKVAGRVASEGAVGVHIAADGKSGTIVEVNCETDFVAKDTNFKAFVSAELQQVQRRKITSSVVDEDVLRAWIRRVNFLCGLASVPTLDSAIVLKSRIATNPSAFSDKIEKLASVLLFNDLACSDSVSLPLITSGRSGHEVVAYTNGKILVLESHSGI